MKQDKSHANQLLSAKGAFSSLSSSAIPRNNESKLNITQHLRSSSSKANSRSPSRSATKTSSPVPKKPLKSDSTSSPKILSKTQSINSKPSTEKKPVLSDSFSSTHTKKVKTNENRRSEISPNQRSLSSQATKEKIKIETDFKQAEQGYKNEIKKLKAELEKAKKTIEQLRNNSRNLLTEKEKLLLDMDKEFNASEQLKNQCKQLVTVLVEVVGVFAGNRADWIYEGDMRDMEKSCILDRIRKILTNKLEVLDKSGLDLAEEIVQVKAWTSSLDDRIVQSTAKMFEYAQSDSEEDQGSEDSLKLSLPKEEELNQDLLPNKIDFENNFHAPKSDFESGFHAPKSDFESGLHPLNPLRDIIKSSFEEKPLIGIALYDFEGELDEDLQFQKGDIIEILEQNETGWWIGRNDSRTGSFPYNFVQLNLS
ncbi:FCHO1 [Blepharisma stoltei]|uniref:SH3 domain-containing protein n=1 Tax=Blepharisma stoltei TaxID=1481888 RepID=A0AAU9JYQ8_9CILI|nr:unnamed protein product [Blepharisma stoltei]